MRPPTRPDRHQPGDPEGVPHSQAHGRRRPGLPGVVPPPSYLGDSVWMQFTDHDTDIVRGQLVEDSFERWYFCSPTTGPMFNTYARMRDWPADVQARRAGADTIDAAGQRGSIASIAGGAAPVVTRAYTYTWVNEFGEESRAGSAGRSAPATPTRIWTIGNIKRPRRHVAPAMPPTHKKCLYRTITGASGQTTYYRVAEIAARHD